MSDRRPFGNLIFDRPIPGENEFDPYREFAFEVCIKAIEDYATYVAQPDFQEDVEQAKKFLEEARKIGELYKGKAVPLKTMKRLIRDCIDSQSGKMKRQNPCQMKQIDSKHSKHSKHMEMVNQAKRFSDLGEIVRIIQGVGNLIYENAVRKSITRVHERTMCKRFIESEQFYQYCGLENGKEITRHIEETYGGKRQ